MCYCQQMIDKLRTLIESPFLAPEQKLLGALELLLDPTDGIVGAMQSLSTELGREPSARDLYQAAIWALMTEAQQGRPSASAGSSRPSAA